MSNGSAALSIVDPAPVVAPSNGTSVESRRTPATSAEVELGAAAAEGVWNSLAEAVAGGVTMLCKAIVDHHQTGAFDPKVKDAVATQVAAVAMLWLDHAVDDADFIRKARESGRARLRRHFNNDCNMPPNANPDAAINIALDEMLGLVSQIVRDERIFRTVWAN